MTTLYHFGGKQFDENGCPPLNNDHKPGGLWLTEGGIDGWKDHVKSQISERPFEWCYGDLKFVTVFEIDPVRSAGSLLTIACKEDLNDFVGRYLEKSKRNCSGQDLERIKNRCIPSCSGQCYNCYGSHIDWNRVKDAYKGLALTFYSKNISHYSQDPSLHWSRFDCASWCFWDPSYLTLVEKNRETGYTCDGTCHSTYCPMKMK